jgi:hypothetical protein
MTIWSPDYRIKANGTDVTDISLVGFTITAGRSDFNAPTNTGVLQLNLINLTNETLPFGIKTSISIEVKDSSGTYVPLYGGRISDVSTEVTTAGSAATVTNLRITALGPLSLLPRGIYDGTITENLDGYQMAQLLGQLYGDQWNEVPPSETWATYQPTETWLSAGALFGEFDDGVYTLRSQNLTNAIISQVANSISGSAGGYLYEDALGRIGYADASHRSTRLVTDGYTDLDARQALASGISAVTRQGDLVNKFVVNHGNNFSSTHIAESTESQSEFGLYGSTFDSYVKNTTDVENFAEQIINLRAFPQARFQSITFPVHSTEIDDTDRDALLGIDMGLPIKVTNLPLNILNGEFTGFIESWSWRSTVNGLFLTFSASPTSFSVYTQQWKQVSASETWNSLNVALEWADAIGVIA